MDKANIEKAVVFGAFSFVGGLIARKIYDKMNGGNDDGNI